MFMLTIFVAGHIWVDKCFCTPFIMCSSPRVIMENNHCPNVHWLALVKCIILSVIYCYKNDHPHFTNGIYGQSTEVSDDTGVTGESFILPYLTKCTFVSILVELWNHWLKRYLCCHHVLSSSLLGYLKSPATMQQKHQTNQSWHSKYMLWVPLL